MSKKINVDSIAVPKGVTEPVPKQVDFVTENSVVDPTVNLENAAQEVQKKSFWTRELFVKRDKTEKGNKVESEKSKVERPKKEAVAKTSKNNDETKKKIFHKRRIIEWAIVLSSFLFLFLLLAGSAFAEQEIYKNKVFPGVVVWDIPVGGKTAEEVQKLIAEKLKNYKITLNGPDQNYTATATDLGVMVNPETVAQIAFTTGRTGSFVDQYLLRAKLAISLINWSPLQKAVQKDDLKITPDYQTDQITFDAYINKVADNIKITPQDSQVSTTGGTIKLVPAVYGRQVLVDKLKSALLDNIANFKSSDIQIETNSIKPNIIDKDAEQVRIQTENVISRPIVLTYQGQEYRPDKATVASWVSYTKPANSSSYSMVIDTSKMQNYFNFLGSKINVDSVPKNVRVENGVKETVTQEGKDGLKVDSGLLGRQIAAALPVQPQINLAIPTYVDPFKTEYQQIVVADWDKYIDVNLTTQTMTAYTKGGDVVGSWLITSGRDGLSTPLGTSLIYSKIFVTSMPNPPSPYPLTNIHYVSYFRAGGYAIHESWWRSTYGGQDYHWNGSHGCVNASIDVAHFIYDWAPIGTPVTVHY